MQKNRVQNRDVNSKEAQISNCVWPSSTGQSILNDRMFCWETVSNEMKDMLENVPSD